jgi:hypothetical protein
VRLLVWDRGVIEARVNAEVDKPSGPFGAANFLGGELRFTGIGGESIPLDWEPLRGCFLACETNYEATLSAEYRIPPAVSNLQLHLFLQGGNVTQYALDVKIPPILLHPEQ